VSEAKIVAETDEYVDVQLLGVEEMEVERGMSLAEWTERYEAAAISHMVRMVIDEPTLKAIRAAAESDFLMIEGGPEYRGRCHGLEMLRSHRLRKRC
jgi:hypothetical protein